LKSGLKGGVFQISAGEHQVNTDAATEFCRRTSVPMCGARTSLRTTWTGLSASSTWSWRSRLYCRRLLV